MAVKSTVASVDSTVDANTVLFDYSNSTFYDVTFSSGNSTIFFKTTNKIVSKAAFSGTNIPSNTFIKHIVDGTHAELTKAPTGSPASNSTYTVGNPAHATITVQKVDFSEAVFASNSSAGLQNPNSFFTYETAGTYRDENNYLVGRKNEANVVVLTHLRLDTNATATSILANSQLDDDELVYWKSVNAYDDEIRKNELRKEIFVIDVNAVNLLDDNLEAILNNV